MGQWAPGKTRLISHPVLRCPLSDAQTWLFRSDKPFFNDKLFCKDKGKRA
ncbi:hypothetical protein KR100_07075 [Synechococcus sp. KORDI-100]|nr:hypothetical protein KR100_07075 [Synechococcus sp. KORDI-100]